MMSGGVFVVVLTGEAGHCGQGAVHDNRQGWAVDAVRCYGRGMGEGGWIRNGF